MLFRFSTLDLWINIEMNLKLSGVTVISGKAQFKVNKSSTIIKLGKKLKMFGIKVWCHNNKKRE